MTSPPCCRMPASTSTSPSPMSSTNSTAPCARAIRDFDRAEFDVAYRHSRRAARHQDPRHLRPAVEARRQARLSPPHPARLALSRAQPRASAARRPEALVRHASARRAPRGRVMAARQPGHGSRRGLWPAHAAAHAHAAEAAGGGRRQGAHRLWFRPAARRGRRGGGGECPLSAGADRGLGAAADRAPHRHLGRARANSSIPGVASRGRFRFWATRPSSSSTATASGWMTEHPALDRLRAAWDDRGDGLPAPPLAARPHRRL